MNAGLYLFVDKVYGDRRLIKKKHSDQEALKILQKKFAKEVKDIFGVIDNFREGVKAYDVFTTL